MTEGRMAVFKRGGVTGRAEAMDPREKDGQNSGAQHEMIPAAQTGQQRKRGKRDPSHSNASKAMKAGARHGP
jgi:hypothetical protein